jgi:hypothetical protein
MTIPISGRIWTGDEWDAHVQLLLKHHYGPDQYQHVPSRGGGDHGIEGFARDGTAYQCYSAEGILTTKQLYEKQRNKITADLRKFARNRAALTALFGTTSIRTWLLVVPEFRSAALRAHANSKAAEICALGLPYVDPSFQVGIVTDDHFSSLLDALVAKVDRMPTIADPTQRDRFIAVMVEGYERGQFATGFLRMNFPDLYERLVQCKSARERLVELDCVATATVPTEVLRRALSDLERDFREALPNLDPSAIADLVREAVADWLMRCPLDFPTIQSSRPAA